MINKFKTLTIGLALASTYTAIAETYSCGNVDGEEEQSIYVDTKKGKAAFFDNDTIVVTPFKDMRILESLPPQTLYIFEGEDRNGRLAIHFNKSRLSAFAILNPDSRHERSVEALDGCRLDRSVRIEDDGVDFGD